MNNDEQVTSEPPMDGIQAINYVKNALKKKYNHFLDYLKFIQDVFDLQKKNDFLLQSIIGSSLNP